MIVFDKRDIKPMLIGKEGDPFDSSDYIYELKWDGERCIAYLDPGVEVELRNKRNYRMLPKVPELTAIHTQAKRRCILDGELMVLKNGKPDFFEIQRRSLTTNKFKIDLSSKKYPATFVAFDVLFYENRDVTMLPLLQRKELLSGCFEESNRLALSRYIENNGISFYNIARSHELEGIVAKRKDSIYIQEKRTTDWIKIKYMKDDDFVICGYIAKENNMTSLILGKYRGDTLCYKGHVTLGVGSSSLEIIKLLPLVQPEIKDIPSGHGNESAVWVRPTLVGTIKYMPRVQSSSMNSPVFKGIRQDKKPKECQET